MARCPNCDRETVRTKDWVCLHCGYPLLSGSYKIIDNTFRELKDMVESGQITEEEIIRRPLKKVKPEAPPKQRQQPAAEQSAPEPPKQSRPSLFGRPKQPQPTESKPEPSPKTEPAPAPKPAASRPTPTPPPTPATRAAQPGSQAASPPIKTPSPGQAQSTPASPTTPKTAAASTPPGAFRPSRSPYSRPQPTPAPKPEPKPEARPAATQPPSAKPEPVQAQPQTQPQAKPQDVRPETPPEVKPAPSPAQPSLEITVEELISTYETEGPGAEAKFAGKILKLTGSIDRINVRDALNIYQIVLNSPKKNVLLQGVRCVFDKSRAAELNLLIPGQTVTVQGKYDGSIIDISLRDCVLVS